ncbi:transcriptional regulator FtsR [Granulicoccus sp. GXG6511]|uniref:transcriptional regulator FtsR n=1 Tax=Granulicoccus sp. GXG6511 TaxID=3381351 RepID=UPI003D7EFD3E
MAGPSLLSIGQVMTLLRAEFPDISISKIRFLESEGLVSPERAASGYRKYAERDIDRLKYILRVQKSHYLPLKVIREHLEMMDRGMVPPQLETPRPAPPSETDPVAPPGAPQPEGVRPGAARQQLRLSRAELLEASGLSEAALVELEKEHIVTPRRGTNYYGRDAVAIAIAARRLAPYGIDVRHLRQVKSYASREYGIIEQAIAPYQRRAGGSRKVAADVTQLMIHVHAAMMRIASER